MVKKEEKKEITHTFIGDKDLKIHGGSYHIPKDEMHCTYSMNCISGQGHL
jgi:hypothetical protein